jgi:hypothetical protein
MPKSIQNFLKGLLTLILSIATFILLQQLLTPFLQVTMVLSQNYESSIFVKNGLLLPSRIVMGVLIVAHLIIIFVVFGRNVHKNVIIRGLLCGAAFGVFWLIPFSEAILTQDAAVVPYMLGSLRDFSWITLTGLYTSLIFSRPKESATRRSRIELLAIPLIGLFFAIGHSLQYYLTFPPLHQSIADPVWVVWLFIQSWSIGFIYYLFRNGIKVQNMVMKSLCFSFIIIGLNWILNNFFIVCVISLPLFDMSIRVFIGLIGVFVGTLLFELIAGKYQKSPKLVQKTG